MRLDLFETDEFELFALMLSSFNDPILYLRPRLLLEDCTDLTLLRVSLSVVERLEVLT